jgi:hypothetical protein
MASMRGGFYEAERLGDPQVDLEFELDWLDNGQFRQLVTHEHSSRVAPQ